MALAVIPRPEWIDRFATRLMLLQPRLHAVAAAGEASQAYDSLFEIEPEVAVEALVADRAPREGVCDDDAPSNW